MSLKQFLCELSDVAYHDGVLQRETIRAMFPLLGAGASRCVFEITYEDKTYAVKFVHNECYSRDNRREARAWRVASKDTRTLMAEVYGTSTCGRVLAMELVPQTLRQAGSPFGVYDKWTIALRNALEKDGWDYNETGERMIDNHFSNIGVRENGDVVWIDYAVV